MYIYLLLICSVLAHIAVEKNVGCRIYGILEQ